jgi:DNA polymerase-3 subunit epsilon
MIELFLDTETTGLSYSNNHKIIEIACVETEDLIPTKNIFHKLINPKRDVPNEAYKIHGLSSELLNTKETFDKIADEFKNFIKDKKLIIHNAPFDIGFLNHELSLVKVEEIKKNQVIDTLDLARSMYPGTSNSLDALCRKFNIDLTRRTKHNALLDCELLREVYINLIGVKEPKLIFSNEEEIKVSEIKKTKDYSKRVVQLTTEETENHKNFIKKEIKKNYY